MKERLLLHVCCAPCLAYPITLLSDYDVLCFFSNSNIYPEEELYKRKESFERFCKVNKINYFIDEYNYDSWTDFIKGFENEPEKGKRCELCFHYRLDKSFNFAKKNGIKKVTTTLTVAPYKSSNMVFKVACSLSNKYGIEFLEFDFKKKDGYKKTKEIAKKENLYIQDYCGCYFSLNDKLKRV